MAEIEEQLRSHRGISADLWLPGLTERPLGADCRLTALVVIAAARLGQSVNAAA
jgi:hypothetical protein